MPNFQLRRQVLRASSLAASWPLVRSASAQADATKYPTQPIKIIVPFAAGGTLDVALRPISQALLEPFGQPLLIENRAGANGMIGSDLVAKASPDGYTLLAVTASFALNPSMYKDMKYDVLKDFTPISCLMQGVGFIMVVHPSLPVKTVPEFIAYEKKSTQTIAYSSPGIGNTIHIASELFNQKTGTHMLHVPYKGSAPSLNALVGGEVQVAIMPPGIVMPFIRSGKLRAIGFTGEKRLAELPDVPTMTEVGIKDMVFQGTWMGLFGPAHMQKPIVEKINREFVKALQQPALRQTLSSSVAGYVTDGSTPEQMAKLLRDDLRRYSEILQRLNIQPS